MLLPSFTSNRTMDYSIALVLLFLFFYFMGYFDSRKKNNQLRKKAHEAQLREQQEEALFLHKMQLSEHQDCLEQLTKKVTALETTAVSGS